jgi:beta-N-acetylhexosaminidase
MAAVTTRRTALAATAALPLVLARSRPSAAVAETGPIRAPAASGTAAARARAAAARMSPAQQVGQLLMVGAPATDPEQIAVLVRRHHVGGVLLDGRSTLGVTATAAQVAGLRRAVGSPGTSGAGLWVATNQEGGFVQTLGGPGFSTIPTAQAQWALTGPELVAASALWARQLARAGVDVNLAPVTDVVPGNPLDNPPIGALEREYGRTPDDVEWAVAKVVQGYASAGVTATLKHFPGLGKVTANTDTHADVVDPITTRSALTEQPWRTGITAGAGLVMVASARYARIDPRHLAVFSSTIITGMLRGDLGWTGVVISDDLGPAVAVAAVAPGLRAVSFVAAGGDVVLTADPNLVPEMAAAVLARGHASPAFGALISAAVVRVLTRKAVMGLLPG